MIQNYTIQYQSILDDAVKMAYIESGKGLNTILFVHGLGHSQLAWQQNIQKLSEQFKCIAIDLPGNGYSSNGDYPYSMDFFAESIHSFIKAKKLNNVFVCGHSMGGQIALTLALKYPKSLDGLVLCAPAGFEVFNDWEKNLYRSTMLFMDLISNEENSLKKAIQSSFYIVPDNVQPFIHQLTQNLRAQPLPSYRRMIEMCINSMLDEPVYDRLSEITLPVQIIFGEKDSMIPNKFIHPISTALLAKEVSLKFQNGELELIPQCGHFVQWEKASRVNSSIRHFIIMKKVV